MTIQMVNAMDSMKSLIRSKGIGPFPGYFHFSYTKNTNDKKLYVVVVKLAIASFYRHNTTATKSLELTETLETKSSSSLSLSPSSPSIPITEMKNEFSSQLDGSLSCEKFLRVLRNTDAQIFAGTYIYVYIYIYIYICSYTHTHKRINTNTHTYTCIHSYIHAYIHTLMLIIVCI